MTKEELFFIIKRNKISKKEAIVLIADFLVTDKKQARYIYEEEFEK